LRVASVNNHEFADMLHSYGLGRFSDCFDHRQARLTIVSGHPNFN
jgi:hypothetical protein